MKTNVRLFLVWPRMLFGNNVLYFSFEMLLLWPSSHRLLHMPVLQISELKWSEECQHTPTASWPLYHFISINRMGCIEWNSSKDVYFSPVLYQNSTYREPMNPVDISHPKHRFLLFLDLLLKILTINSIPPPLKNSYPNHSICPARKKVFTRICDTVLKKKKQTLTVDLTVLHKIFTNHSRLKGGFMHFHILLGLKQQFSARTTEKKNICFTLLILITFFHYPSCFLQACVLLLQNVMK